MEEESEDKSVPEIVNACNMKQVIYWIASAWEELALTASARPGVNYYQREC